MSDNANNYPIFLHEQDFTVPNIVLDISALFLLQQTMVVFDIVQDIHFLPAFEHTISTNGIFSHLTAKLLYKSSNSPLNSS